MVCRVIPTVGIAVILGILGKVAYAGSDLSIVSETPPAAAADVAPTITTHPSNQSVPAGVTVSFSAAASGSPTPTVQWQARRGDTFSDISGATATTYSETATSTNNGAQFAPCSPIAPARQRPSRRR